MALSIAAASGAVWVYRLLSTRRSALGTSAFLVAVIGTTMTLHLFTFANNISVYQQRVGYAYLPGKLVSILSIYRDPAGDQDVLLTSPLVGNLVPAFTGRRTYIGHGVQTIDSNRKTEEAIAFFSGALDEDASRAFLSARGITHVLTTPDETGTSAVDFDAVSYLQDMAREGEFVLYRVSL